ncbi:hypothetical protein [Ottowia sp. SB7-C50]|uniref:hypothetical protein n=1 Tax=Ottowia sp. SB7-C50 TaxID=3081231 RepID=UPI00295443D1|nr:hypothetical protein [Ottowia sp. SB7-C50]WOP14585.1 hypothetical protein R0D99_12105 [Ottowia sp. SB7-C50]
MATKNVTARAPEADKATLSLDTCPVANWGSKTPASVLNSEAGMPEALSWLHTQVGEINSLLWGFIQLNDADAEASMAPPLCHFIEGRTTVMLSVLERLRETLGNNARGATVGG